jgi:hypothetical protein
VTLADRYARSYLQVRRGDVLDNPAGLRRHPVDNAAHLHLGQRRPARDLGLLDHRIPASWVESGRGFSALSQVPAEFFDLPEP